MRIASPLLTAGPILGTLDEIQAIFPSRVVDEIALCLPATAVQYLEPISLLAADEGISAMSARLTGLSGQYWPAPQPAVIPDAFMASISAAYR